MFIFLILKKKPEKKPKNGYLKMNTKMKRRNFFNTLLFGIIGIVEHYARVLTYEEIQEVDIH